MWCILDRTYRWVDALPESQSIPIPTFVTEELLQLSVLSPFLYTDLHATVDRRVGTTDASPDGLGGCVVDFSQKRANQLYRDADLKGERVKLGAVWAAASLCLHPP